MSEHSTIAQFVPVKSLTIPANVRTKTGLDNASLAELAASIKLHGLIQPIVVQQHESGYAVIAGQRRTLAAKLAGLDNIQAIVLDASVNSTELLSLQITENLQRENLSLSETAQAVRELLAIHGKPATVADTLKKSKAWVSKHLTLTAPTFPTEVRELLNSGDCEDLDTLLTLAQIAKRDEGAGALPSLINGIKTGQIGRQKVRDALDKLKEVGQAELPLDGNDEGEGGEGEGDGVEDEPTGRATITFELSDSQAKQFEELGGAQWLRRHLKKIAKATA